DRQGGDALRRSAMQIYLLAAEPDQAQAAAIEALSGSDTAVSGIALKYLSGIDDDLARLEPYDIYLRMDYLRMNTVHAGSPITPEAPKGLTAEMLRPLLAGGDEETAAYAGYLLALLKDP